LILFSVAVGCLLTSVWDKSIIEGEMWDAIFGRAIAIASKTAQTTDIVVSHFFKLLSEAKFVSWVILCWKSDAFLVQLLD
jgi:hypothetical protein